MARRFYGSIDVSKISKDKLIKGKKGLYLPLTIWLNDQPDQFGNSLAIQEELSKEEREAGKKANYLGNLKEADGAPAAKEASTQSDEGDDDLPF